MSYLVIRKYIFVNLVNFLKYSSSRNVGLFVDEVEVDEKEETLWV